MPPPELVIVNDCVVGAVSTEETGERLNCEAAPATTVVVHAVELMVVGPENATFTVWAPAVW